MIRFNSIREELGQLGITTITTSLIDVAAPVVVLCVYNISGSGLKQVQGKIIMQYKMH